MTFRSIRKWLVPLVCLGVLVISPLLIDVLRSRTEVTIHTSAQGISAQVHNESVGIPADVLARHPDFAKLDLMIEPDGTSAGKPSDSLYWVPAQGGPFEFIGKIGEWLQSLRWESKWVGHSGQSATLLGGRTPATVELVSPATRQPVFKLIVHPEGRTLTWLEEVGPGQEVQVSRGFYRPRGRVSIADFASELLWAAMAASVLCLVAWVVGAALSSRSSPARAETATMLRPKQQGSLLRLLDRPYVPSIALFLGGTILASAAAIWALDGIPHVQDEVGYIFQGKIFAHGASYVPTPPGPEFFANGFIQMFEGKWFAKYPPGFPLLLVPGMWAGLPWLIDPLCAGVSLALIYAAGIKMFGRQVATWAALLGLVSPWVIFMSGSYMSHPSTMMWVAVFLYALVCTKQTTDDRRQMTRLAGDQQAEGSKQQAASVPAHGPNILRIAFPVVRRLSSVVYLAWPLIAGFALGMAFITRQWTAAGIGVGCALWVLGDIALTRGPGRWRKFGRYCLIIVGMLPPILLILYENRQLTGDWLRFTQDLVGSYDQPGFGPGHGDSIGHTPALGVYNALVYWRSLGSMFDGWPVPFALAPLLLGAVAWVGERSRRLAGWDALLWLGTLGLVGAYFVWWSNTTIFGPRYWYEAMPFLLLMAGRGLDLLGRAAASVACGIRANTVRWCVPGAIFAVFTLYTLTQSIPYWAASYKDYNGISAEPLRAAQAAHLKNALIFVQLDPAKPNRDYGKVFAANDPLLRGDEVFARDLGSDKNRSLLGYFPGRQPYYLPLDGPPRPGFGP